MRQIMVKRVGTLFRKPIVIGDSNTVRKNQILLEKKNNKVKLSIRDSGNELKVITEGNSTDTENIIVPEPAGIVVASLYPSPSNPNNTTYIKGISPLHFGINLEDREELLSIALNISRASLKYFVYLVNSIEELTIGDIFTSANSDLNRDRIIPGFLCDSTGVMAFISKSGLEMLPDSTVFLVGTGEIKDNWVEMYNNKEAGLVAINFSDE